MIISWYTSRFRGPATKRLPKRYCMGTLKSVHLQYNSAITYFPSPRATGCTPHSVITINWCWININFSTLTCQHFFDIQYEMMKNECCSNVNKFLWIWMLFDGEIVHWGVIVESSYSVATPTWSTHTVCPGTHTSLQVSVISTLLWGVIRVCITDRLGNKHVTTRGIFLQFHSFLPLAIL